MTEICQVRVLNFSLLQVGLMKELFVNTFIFSVIVIVVAAAVVLVVTIVTFDNVL
jgi:hypothetical protein